MTPCHSPSGYCSALTKLLQLAPTPEYPEILFRTSGSACKAQTILVTHYIDSLSFQQNDCSTSIDEGACDESCEYSTNDDSSVSATTSDEGSSTESEESIIRSKETASRSPWPIDHDQFLANTSTQQHLCLEIAGGSAAIHPPAWICSTARSKIGGSNQQSAKESSVLLPGSLRERGEFCILQLSLVENKQIESSPRPRFSWEVLQVDFHQVNNFGKA